MLCVCNGHYIIPRVVYHFDGMSSVWYIIHHIVQEVNPRRMVKPNVHIYTHNTLVMLKLEIRKFLYFSKLMAEWNLTLLLFQYRIQNCYTIRTHTRIIQLVCTIAKVPIILMEYFTECFLQVHLFHKNIVKALWVLKKRSQIGMLLANIKYRKIKYL